MAVESVIRCTVCGQQLAEPLEHRGRHYCLSHLHAFSDDIQAVWQASGLAFALMVVIAVGAAVAGQILPAEPQGAARLGVSAAVAVVPSLAWLVFLYHFSRGGRSELSPLMPTVFVLAALIAAAITRPILNELIGLEAWLAQAPASTRFLTSILIGGALHTLILYSIVRYTVWRTPVFTHRVEGVLFGMVAAWGYVAIINLLFVIDRQGLSLVNGSFRLLAQTCGYLIAGIVIGFFLGRNRFEDLPFYYLPGGAVLAAALSGLVLYAGNALNSVRVSLTTSGYSAWPGLAFSLVALGSTILAVYGLLRRHNALTKSQLERKL